MPGSKKNLASTYDRKLRLAMLDWDEADFSLREQCKLLGLNRSGLYYKPTPYTARKLAIMRRIDEIYTEFPGWGGGLIGSVLRREGHIISDPTVRRYMREMGLQALSAGPHTSKPHPEHKIYPYLLRDITASYPNHIWGTDITYIRMAGGFMYLVAFMDWYSRFVLSWALSDSLADDFVVEALTQALMRATPDIANSDQGSQYTGLAYTNLLTQFNVKISMDGRGRCMDNIFTERFWRTLKQEEVYLKEYESPRDARIGIGTFINAYNDFRPHSSLGGKTPREVYFDRNT